jgi:hypothetical protein
MQPTQDPSITRTPAEILALSADYLAAHGWISKAMYDLCDDSCTPPACVVGAIRVAVFGRPIYNDLDFDEFVAARAHQRLGALVIKTEHRLLRLLPDRTETYPECSVMDRITIWNDWPGRTAVEVIGTLRHAASALTADMAAAR